MGNMSLNWRNVSGNLVSIDAAGRNVWGVNRDDEIWRFDWNRDSWEKMPGRAVQVSCSEDGAVWCINRQENIFQWTGSQWEQRPGALRRISVGSHQHVWGCNNRDEIYYWQNNNWNKSDGACREISVGNDGVVWCVNANEDIWVKRGGPNSNWTQLPGKAVKISAFNSNTVLGLNRQNEVWAWGASSWRKLQSSVPLAHIAIGGHQYAWGLDHGGQIYHHGTSFGNGPSVTVGMGSTHSVSHSHSVHHHHPPHSTSSSGISISLPGAGIGLNINMPGISVGTGYAPPPAASYPSTSTGPTSYPSTSGPTSYPSTSSQGPNYAFPGSTSPPVSYPSTQPSGFPSTSPNYGFPGSPSTPNAYPNSSPNTFPNSSPSYPPAQPSYPQSSPSYPQPAYPAPAQGYPAQQGFPAGGFPDNSSFGGSVPSYPPPVVSGYPAQMGVQVSIGGPGFSQSYPASKQQVDDLINDCKRAFAKDQCDALRNSVASRNIVNLTANDCGAIVKALWKQNQLYAARFLQPLCPDQAGYRAAMEQNMWMGEYKAWINA